MTTIATLLRYQYGFIEELADLVLDVAGEHLFVTLSVRQLLWGYEDPLLKDVRDLLLKHHVHLPFNDTFGLFSKVVLPYVTP
nr:hypothetical protein BaRGS_026731 [Batillaria attramentaria]